MDPPLDFLSLLLQTFQPVGLQLEYLTLTGSPSCGWIHGASPER